MSEKKQAITVTTVPKEADVTMTTAAKLVLAQTLVKEYAEENKPVRNFAAMKWAEEGVDKILEHYNELKGTDVAAKDLGEVFQHIETLRDIYNKASRNAYMITVSQQDDAMMFVINNPHYPIIKIQKGRKSNGFKESKEASSRRIDLLDLNNFCNHNNVWNSTSKTIGATGSWVSAMVRVWYLFQARGVIDTISAEYTETDIAAEKAKAKDGEKISDAEAKKRINAARIHKAVMLNFGESLANEISKIGCVSNTMLEKELRKMAVEMLGDTEERKKYLPKLTDVRYILKVCAKRSKKEENTVEYVKLHEFSDIIMDVLRCRVCGVEYKDVTHTK